MKKILLSLALLLTSLSVQARWVCCINVADGFGGTEDSECVGFEDKEACNKACPLMCSQISDKDSGDVLD